MQPRVDTFHSYARSIINKAAILGYLPHSAVWAEESEYKYLNHVHTAIQNLERKSSISLDLIDPDEVKTCIGLWKGSLIPPHLAGHKTKPEIAQIYAEFENLRIKENAITYDDFIPIAVGILKSDEKIRQSENHYKFVIVDEYQDINLGQQRMVELIAGNHADVMLIGDDDQTIYEWRGARPDYI